jgi:hypothetical protein
MPLSDTLAAAIAALQAQPFEQRIATARARLAKEPKK